MEKWLVQYEPRLSRCFKEQGYGAPTGEDLAATQGDDLQALGFAKESVRREILEKIGGLKSSSLTADALSLLDGGNHAETSKWDTQSLVSLLDSVSEANFSDDKGGSENTARTTYSFRSESTAATITAQEENDAVRNNDNFTGQSDGSTLYEKGAVRVLVDTNGYILKSWRARRRTFTTPAKSSWDVVSAPSASSSGSQPSWTDLTAAPARAAPPPRRKYAQSSRRQGGRGSGSTPTRRP